MADKYINMGGHKLTTDKDVLFKQKTTTYGGTVYCYKAGNVVTITLSDFTTAPPINTDINLQIFDSTEEDWKPQVTVWGILKFGGTWSYQHLMFSNINTNGSMSFYTYETGTRADATFTYVSKG